ncbi:GNAT family N-acetyltransferase [Leptolyngbya iicbica]|uniref:GNAT family N-acetyltransferase n=2 Tax=Cyanophyceae TaxID=3028117 RepID=A0A4Q7E912_9CYAN|nr:GNAT family N-acetyltransferase [Leptolyngbya sp. LK]RZM78894.1 GNAT family N-acetyltransferase [Leptolyngbya sp. LK]
MTAVCQIRPGDFASEEAQALVSELDQHLAELYADYIPDLYGMKQADVAQPRSGFWLACVVDQVAGCVAVRPFTHTKAELKRMYVRPAFRNRGIGKQLLATAETAAIAWGYTHLCLETGEAQPASLHLYTQAGFQTISCFGHYDDPESRCYEKVLTRR